MPVYLLHGFRWPRQLIRIHIILQNLDDAAAEWLVAPATTATLLKNFHDLYPDSMKHLEKLRFVEQYDPNDTSPGAGSQPYAYIGDVVEEIKLGVDVDDVRGKGVPSDQWAAMMELRDKLAPEEKVAWYVVVCGDEERWAPPTVGLLQHGGSSNVSQHRGSEGSSMYGNSNGGSGQPQSPQEEPAPARGLKKLFGRRKSRTPVADSPTSSQSQPKVPGPTDGQPQRAGSHKPSDQALQNGTILQRSSSQHTNGAPPKSSGSSGSRPPVPTWEPSPDQEVITGPVTTDDPLSAPPPTIRQGKEADILHRPKPTNNVPAFATGPRTTSPHIRAGNAFAAQQYYATSPQKPSPTSASTSASGSFDRSASAASTGTAAPSMVSALSHQSSARTISPTHTHPGYPNYNHSASPQSLQQPTSRMPSAQGVPSVAGSSRQGGEATNGTTHQRPSQYTVNSMTPAVQANYGYTERDIRHRQSVTPDELVARGLDEGVFAGLR